MKLAVFVAAVFALTASPAFAQEPSADPDASTPAGAIYQLPLDQARGDAAPKRRGGARLPTPNSGTTSASDDSGDAPPSALRSENGFGSSSVVPGTESDGGTAAGADKDAKSVAGQARDGGAAGGGIVRGSSADTPAAPAPAAKTASAAPSSTRVYLLLALVLAVGIAGGLATRMRGRDSA